MSAPFFHKFLLFGVLFISLSQVYGSPTYLIKPANPLYSNSNFTYENSKGFFLGTGGESHHFTLLWKYPTLNLIFPEKWEVNKKAGTLRNAETGLYLRYALSAHPGGFSALIMRVSSLKDDSSPPPHWEFVRKHSNVYMIVSTLVHNGIVLALAAEIEDDTGNVVLTLTNRNDDDINQHWAFK